MRKIAFFTLFFFFTSCALEKKISITEKPQLVVEASHYSMSPIHQSNVFLDKTDYYGLTGVKAVHLYAVDVNHDGYTDLVTLEDFYSSPKFYFYNHNIHKFVLGQSPFVGTIRASFLNFVDLNHDGIYDVIVGVLNQKTEMTQYPARVFKGIIENGELFYREQSPLPTNLLPTASISAVDFNLDGDLDLFLSNWFSYKDPTPKPVPDLLLKGNGFDFSDHSRSLKGEYDFNQSTKQFSNATPTFGASVCDIDNNGFPDILTSNSNGYYNKLWMNLDGFNFVNYGNESGFSADEEGSPETLGGGNSFFNLCGDYNSDGIVDVVNGTMSKDTDPDYRDKSSILTGSTFNFPPKFIHSDFYRDDQKSHWSQADRRGVWIDYNLDGLIDLLIDNSGFPPESRLILFEQKKDHSFEDKSNELGIDLVNPSGTITIDLNHDGVMDFITGQSTTRSGENNNRVYVFENQTKRGLNGSVRFHLQAKNSNFFGLGSTLRMKTDHHNYFFNVEYNSGSLPSQNEEGAYFSFGKDHPKELIVRWSYAEADRLGRLRPVVQKYNLAKLKLSSHHHEFNLCEDGRILARSKNCF